MPGEELSTMLQTATEDGSPVEADDLAVDIALRERRPAHLPVRIRRLDGV